MFNLSLPVNTSARHQASLIGDQTADILQAFTSSLELTLAFMISALRMTFVNVRDIG